LLGAPRSGKTPTRQAGQDGSDTDNGWISWWWAVPVALIGYIVFSFPYGKPTTSPQFQWMSDLKNYSDTILKGYGSTREIRRGIINMKFDRSDGWITHNVMHWDDKYGQEAHIDITISRALLAMPPRVRESLRALELAKNEDVRDKLINLEDYNKLRFGLVYNDGLANVNNIESFRFPANPGERRSSTDALVWLARAYGLSTEQCVSRVAGILDYESVKHPKSYFVKEVGKRFKGGGETLETGDIAESSLFTTEWDEGLFLGSMSDSGKHLLVKPQGHLVTIAGSGTGKTQCQVLPNLLSYIGSAIILDVKGDLYEKTHKYRETVGRVIHYDPLDPHGAPFNPLYFIDNHADKIKIDADRLASGMIVATGKDPFWDISAKNVLQAVIVYHCLKEKPENRHMGGVLDLLNTDELINLVSPFLKEEHHPPDVQRLGKSLDDIPEKTLQAVLTSGNAQLNCWGGPVEKTTHGRPAWLPTDLQDPDPHKFLSVYISLKSGNPKDYKSVLRVLVDTHFQQLTKQHPSTQAEVNPVLIFLDEFGALDKLDTVMDIVNRGRSYGLWLWPFLQSEQQITDLYGNAADFLGNFTVRSYMNPNFQTAERLSKEFGQQVSALDGSQSPIARPEDLSGNKYAGSVIVMGRGEKPTILNKYWAYQSKFFQDRMTSGTNT
jgi:type IV secretion system protein VirD4